MKPISPSFHRDGIHDDGKGAGQTMISGLVNQDGTLNERLIERRETLYTGMNGQRVERLYLASGGQVILKPLTNDSQLGREAWVYAHVLPSFPPIYPRLLAACSGRGPAEEAAVTSVSAASSAAATSADNGTAAGSWCLFEDLGPLAHRFDVSAAEALIPMIARWHALPAEELRDAPLLGPKPMIDALLHTVLRREEELREDLTGIPSGSELLHRVLEPLRGGGRLPDDWSSRVLSHGDLHLGNYGSVNGTVKVLDWEHVHLNSPFWDLYHVLDLSHPVFPKTMTAETRELLLDRYIAAAQSQSASQPALGRADTESEAERGGGIAAAGDFKRSYARFAAVFSLWMLLLIEQDLAALRTAAALPAKWSPEQLRRQRQETLDSFVQCAGRLE